MYQVICDGYPLLDYRDENLNLFNPTIKLEVNTAGSGSFTIYKNHPYYDTIQRFKSIIEVRDEIGVLFRGRMTDNSIDFNNAKAIDLEGVMAFFNDSIIPPYNFPEDFLDDAEYIAASKSGNVVAFFLGWLIEQHNSQVQDFQKFKLGTVTVADPNNYITRSDTDIQSTWDIVKSKLFDSALGGYLCIRYEDDGNYIDYLADFVLTNTQSIEFGENLLDLKKTTKGVETCSAIIPYGAEIEVETGEVDEEGNEIIEKTKVSLESIEDGNIDEDVIKVTLPNGLHALYSASAVENMGWICPKPSETTWSDITTVNNLLTKSVEHLTGTAVMLSNTIDITAVDLHFSDKDIQSFRIYRKVNAHSTPHGLSKTYPLTKLEIPLLTPQNTKITLGETVKTLTSETSKMETNAIQRIEIVEKDIAENRTNVTEVKEQVLIQSTKILNDCEKIILGATESFVEKGDGVVVSDVLRYYLASPSDSGIAIDSEGWVESIPPLSEGNSFLWTYKKVIYSDNSTTVESPYILANYNGLDIASVTDYYAVNSNNTNPKNKNDKGEEIDLVWETSIPKLSTNGFYLWNYYVIDYSDGTKTESEKKVIAEYLYSYKELIESVSTQLSVLAGKISFDFEKTNKNVEDIDGDLQDITKKLEKHFDFTLENGLVIRAGENEMKLRIDNDIISFYKGEINEDNLVENRFGWWDGIDFHTGNIVVGVEERAQFGDYAFVPRSDGSLSFMKVGG